MAIHEKIIQFQAQFKGAEKTGFNPHFKSAYYTADDLRNAVKPILDKLGLYISHQMMPTAEGGIDVWTYVTDEDGDSIKSGFPIPSCNNPQVAGSWITYGQRYNVMGLLFSGGELEDDGSIAAANAPELASRETMATLHDYADGHDERMTFLDKRGSGLTEDQAQTIIDKWRDHD